MNELRARDCRAMLLYVADKVIESKPCLTEVDSAIGDGDHGIGMAGGMEKAKKKLLEMSGTDNVYELFEAMGRTMLMSMGGASGVIFGSLFMGGARGRDLKPQLTPQDFADLMNQSLLVIKSRGGAEIGDKTMVDAFEPACRALSGHSGSGLPAMLAQAEQAAKEGMESTVNMRAKFGRAKSLMERAIGHPDAGATSVWIIFRSMREFAEKLCRESPLCDSGAE